MNHPYGWTCEEMNIEPLFVEPTHTMETMYVLTTDGKVVCVSKGEA